MLQANSRPASLAQGGCFHVMVNLSKSPWLMMAAVVSCLQISAQIVGYQLLGGVFQAPRIMTLLLLVNSSCAVMAVSMLVVIFLWV